MINRNLLKLETSAFCGTLLLCAAQAAFAQSSVIRPWPKRPMNAQEPCYIESADIEPCARKSTTGRIAEPMPWGAVTSKECYIGLDPALASSLANRWVQLDAYTVHVSKDVATGRERDISDFEWDVMSLSRTVSTPLPTPSGKTGFVQWNINDGRLPKVGNIWVKSRSQPLRYWANLSLEMHSSVEKPGDSFYDPTIVPRRTGDNQSGTQTGFLNTYGRPSTGSGDYAFISHIFNDKPNYTIYHGGALIKYFIDGTSAILYLSPETTPAAVATALLNIPLASYISTAEPRPDFYMERVNLTHELYRRSVNADPTAAGRFVSLFGLPVRRATLLRRENYYFAQTTVTGMKIKQVYQWWKVKADRWGAPTNQHAGGYLGTTTFRERRPSSATPILIIQIAT